jgi:hypothetical protein
MVSPATIRNPAYKQWNINAVQPTRILKISALHSDKQQFFV